MGNTIGQRIKDIRKKYNLTQSELADSIGVSKSKISKLESGKENISLDVMHSLCSQFSINFTWLESGTGEMLLREPETKRKPMPNIENIILESMQLKQKDFNFNLDLFDNCLMNYREYIENPMDSAAEQMNVNIITILEKYMTHDEIMEEDLEDKLWEFPNIAYTDGFLQGFQAGFTMNQYISGGLKK